MVGRLLGWIFVALALMCLGADVMAMLERGDFGLLGLGELWAALDANSMIAIGDAIAGHSFPEVWNPGITTLLRVPGLVLFGLVGLVLLVAFRKRERVQRLFTS